MTRNVLLGLLLLGCLVARPAHAQRIGIRAGGRCYARTGYTMLLLTRYHGYHSRYASADTVERPFAASRWGFFMGLAGFNTPHGTFGGAEMEGTFRLAPNVQAGLAGSALIPTRIQSNLGVTDAAKPMLGLYSLTTRAHLFLLDQPRLRFSLLAGAGAGIATLADRSQQVLDKGQDANCGCTPSTHARTLATSAGLVGLAGANATYKLRPDLWLTANAYYQQWAGATHFGRQADVSPWVLSLGVTMPDRWK